MERGSRSKWFTDGRAIKVNDVVLMVSTNAPRGSWPMGIVTEIHEGPDGRVRDVMVKSNNKIYRRSYANLCVIELNE